MLQRKTTNILYVYIENLKMKMFLQCNKTLINCVEYFSVVLYERYITNID